MKVRFSATAAMEQDRRVSESMSRMLAYGARAASETMTPEVEEARKNRAVMRRTGGAGGGGGASGGFGDIQFATGRPRDPLFYWRQNNLPYDFSQNEELAKVRAFCRLLYQTDPIVGSVVDIYSKFPTLGDHLECKDARLEDFYGDLFFGEDHLDYEEFTVDIGREYWTSGEAWPFATFNEDLGIWDDEELLNPDDIKVERSPFLKEPRYFIRLPWTIRQILQTRQPAWEYNRLVQEYPELTAYTAENTFMPVSNILLKQLKFRGDTFNVRGVPLLTRAMRSMLQKEMLNTALDSIADRLYTPLILCKLGASATDLGTSQPWIPTDDDLENFELALDAALAGDFRALIYNFAVEMLPVLGRENMPDLSPDFERIEDSILQVFGLSRTFLMGAQCLTGDVMIHVHRAGKGFQMRIKDLVARFNGEDDYLPGRRWDPEIPTLVARADGSVVRLGRLDAAWCSGVKDVFEVRTEGGRSIKASAEHPFMAADGSWVRLGDLRPGDELRVNTGRSARGREWNKSYRVVYVKYHPHQMNDGLHRGKQRFKVYQHRLVMEAALNELPYEEFVEILRTDPARSKELVFLPGSLHVHHDDEDTRNNDPGNLVISTHAEHHGGHHDHTGNVLWQVGTDRVASITPCGQESTYDLRMDGEPHNFLADDFVVHNSGQTYAADALNKELVTMLMTKYQRFQARHFKQRALVVAEAQGHYDYREHGGKRYVIMEEVLETDEETGEKRLVEQPKLLVPERRFKVLNLKDEDATRQFIEALRESGVPISQRTRTRGLEIDLEEEEERSQDEATRQAVKEQETRKATYIALRDKGLPIAPELANDFAAIAQIAPGPSPLAIGSGTIPRLGTEPNGPLMALAPTPEDEEEAEAEEGEEGAPPEGEGPQDQEEAGPGEEDQRPEESDEERAGMPTEAALFKRSAASRQRARERPVKRHGKQEHRTPVFRPDGELQEVREWVSEEAPSYYRAPRVVGTRRDAGLTAETEWPDLDYGTA